MKRLDVARAEVTRRISEVNPHGGDNPLSDVIGTHIDRLTPGQRAQCEEWQKVRSSPITGVQRASMLVASLTAPLLIWLGLAAQAGNESVQSAVCVIAATAVSLLVTASLEADMSRQPGYLSLSVRTGLQSRIRERVSLQPLRNSIDHEFDYRTQATEARLVLVAAGIARSVQLSPIWRSSYLDRADCRHDLTAELALVSRAAVDNLHAYRTAACTQQVICDESCYQGVWSALINRVTWLYCYELQFGAACPRTQRRPRRY